MNASALSSDPVYRPSYPGLTPIGLNLLLESGSDSFDVDRGKGRVDIRLVYADEIKLPGTRGDAEIVQTDFGYRAVWFGAGTRVLSIEGRGISEDTFSGIVQSVPIVGKPELFQAADEPALAATPGLPMLVDWLKAPDASHVEIDETPERHESLPILEAVYSVPDVSLAYLAMANPRRNNLRFMALLAPRSRFWEGGLVPTIVGEYPDGRSQAMWTQRNRFWHYLLTASLDTLLPRVAGIQKDAGGLP